MRKRRTVLVLIVTLKWDLENCSREIHAISKKLHGVPFRPAMHGKRMIGYVVQTDETSRGLMDRLGDSVQAGCVEHVWCQTVGSDIVSLDGAIDPLVSRVAEAWSEVRKWNDPKHMRPPKAGDIFKSRGIKDSERSAAVKMAIKPRRMRQSPENPNQ